MRWLPILLLALTGLCSGQVVVKPHVAAANGVAPSYTMPAGKIYVNTDTVPKARFARAGMRVVPTGCLEPTSGCDSTLFPAPVPSTDDGAFRIVCPSSHVSFDDPIVYPGESGRTHLHLFFGNTTTDAQSRASQMATVGKSTCDGGDANRTGYWVPTMVYHRPGHTRDGEVVISGTSTFYYKTQGHDPTSRATIQWFTPGLQMIAGDPNNTLAANMPGAFECWRGGAPLGTFPAYRFDHIPTSAEGLALGAGGCDGINMLVDFPQCWDGVNLWLPTVPGQKASAHMRYAAGGGCHNPDFPIAFPNIGGNIHTSVNNADLDYLRLSSDQPASSGVPAGRSLHMDWANGWTMTTQAWGGTIPDAILNNCLKVPADCHDDNIGKVYGGGIYYWLQQGR
jgi:hypothetical protein